MNNRDKNNNILEKDYFNDLNKIKETIWQNQNKAMVYVNNQMILTYYEIGTIINQRKTWGSKYIQNLANDLKEYGKGYSVQNLKRMSQLARIFTNNEISSQVVSQIPWGTLMNFLKWFQLQIYLHPYKEEDLLSRCLHQSFQAHLLH